MDKRPAPTSASLDGQHEARPPIGHSSQLISSQNAALQSLSIPAHRIEELPVELNQLFAAALANRARLDFDTEPTSFVVSLARGRENGG